MEVIFEKWKIKVKPISIDKTISWKMCILISPLLSVHQWKLAHFRMIVQNTSTFAVLFFQVNIDWLGSL